jgi:NAD(P)-dependent dehydrogenase (short-subunit alcohol dehydrogenase family)
MGDRLKGKRAFVTAGAAGIGRASAIAFAREGATVFATDIDERGLAALKSEGVSEVAKLDVRDTSAVTEMAKRAGKIDILLNAAGFVHHGTVLECSDEDWDFSFDLNDPGVSAGHAAKRPRLDCEHLLRRRRVQGRTEPLRLRRDQGCGCSADARGRHRFHHQGHTM